MPSVIVATLIVLWSVLGSRAVQSQHLSAADYRDHGNRLRASGHADLGLQHLMKGRALYPEDAHMIVDLADAYADAKNFREALSVYKEALERLEHGDERRTSTLMWIGVCYRRLGDNQQAIEWLQQAVEADTRERDARYHLALSFVTDGQFVQGAKWLAEAMNINARDRDFILLSTVLSALDHWSLLSRALTRCIKGLCRSNSYQIYVECAVALDLAGDQVGATERLDDAGNLTGKTREEVLKDTNEYYQTSRRNQRAAKDIPTDATERKELLLEITNIYQPVLEKSVPVWSIIEDRHIKGFNWPIPVHLITEARELMEHKKMLFQKSNSSQVQHNLVSPYQCSFLPFFDLDDCIFAAQNVATQIKQSLPKQAVDRAMTYNDFDPDDFSDCDGSEPLHVGLFSADIKGHPMLPLINAFVKYTYTMKDVQVTLYHTEADPDKLKKMEKYVDNVHACSGATYLECVEHARRNKVQVWLETTGVVGYGIPKLAAMGPAPVGVHWAGTPSSMGMPSTLQYMVSDRHTVPPDSEVPAKYPEKILYVPGSWMIAEAPYGTASAATRKELRGLYNIPLDAVVYSYFGRTWKIDDVLFRAWLRIIQQVPNSYLLMVLFPDHWTDEDPSGNIRKAWSESGLSEQRLVLLPPYPRGEHIQVMRELSDVALDTSIYGGGTTAYEALYAGLPLVHYSSGWKMMQRAGGSILMSAGLGDELIADDWDGYVKIGIRLGVDKDYYSEIARRLKDALAGRNEATLFRPEVGITAMANGLRQAYQKWKNGNPPSAIFSDIDSVEERDRVESAAGDEL